MTRRLALGALLILSAHAPFALAAQLPLITVPTGALRIDFSGAFYPSDHYWSGGTQHPLGDQIDGTSNPMVNSLESSFGALIGAPVSGLTLGSITTLASQSRGVGDIGLALGLTRRITIFGTLPIVFLRSRVSLTFDPSTSKVGLNPADPDAQIGTDAGRTQAMTFFTEFDAALDSLNTRIGRGDYDGNATTLALAHDTYTRATAMRASLFGLLSDPNVASPVLPTAGDAYGMQLLSQITALQGTFSNDLGVAGFTDAPPLPATTLTSDQFAALLGSPGGFATATQPNSRYTIGDMTAGVAMEVVRHGRPDSAGWRALWLRGTARFPTGALANPSYILDQAAGSRHPAGQLDVIGEAGTGHLGLRVEATYQHVWPWSQLRRLGAPDQGLVPPSLAAAVRSQPGDSMAFTLRPYLAFAPHLAATATVQYWRRSASRTDYVTGQQPIPGTTPGVLDVGSAANATVLGIGLSYADDGPNRDGSSGLPVEAGWSVERTVSSGAGFFPVALTTRMYLKVYRPLFRH